MHTIDGVCLLDSVHLPLYYTILQHAFGYTLRSLLFCLSPTAHAFRTSLFDTVKRFSSRPTKALASSNLLTLRDNLNVLFSASPLAPFERRLFSFLRFIYQLDIAPHRLSGILYHVHTAALASFFASHYIRRAAGIFCLATLRTYISFMQRNLLGGGFLFCSLAVYKDWRILVYIQS
jgi:hypothetical protein